MGPWPAPVISSDWVGNECVRKRYLYKSEEKVHTVLKGVPICGLRVIQKETREAA